MPQRLKEDVRSRILAAAAAVFADKGYAAAKMSDVAERAGATTSNIYKYYDSKEVLFHAVVTPALAAQLLRLLRARVRELGAIDNWVKADAEGSSHARALLSFWIENRHVVLILLRGAEETRYAHVRHLMIREMQRRAADYVSARQGDPPLMQFMLQRLFTRTIDTIADILQHYADGASIQQAFGLFWRYQLAGLQSLLELPPGREGGDRP